MLSGMPDLSVSFAAHSSDLSEISKSTALSAIFPKSDSLISQTLSEVEDSPVSPAAFPTSFSSGIAVPAELFFLCFRTPIFPLSFPSKSFADTAYSRSFPISFSTADSVTGVFLTISFSTCFFSFILYPHL